jgi:NADPH:quinone reductase-like Zn-dependent oxidoreductase
MIEQTTGLAIPTDLLDESTDSLVHRPEPEVETVRVFDRLDKMKALRFHKFGGPEVMVFEEIPIPHPGPGQVLVKVAGSGVNPIDWKLREGHVGRNVPLPATMSREFSGTVERLGDGVSDLAIGDEVYGIADGSCAEYVVSEASATGLKPPSMDLADAAAVPLAGMTAYQALFDTADIKAGHRVVITAASGGVGTFAIQLAKWKGAYVIASTSAKNAHLAQELGADEIVDYAIANFEDVVQDVDMVLDALGGDTAVKSLKALKPGGIVVSLASEAPSEQAAAAGKRAVHIMMQPKRHDLDHLSALIQDLLVRPVIDTVVRFDEAIAAEKESQGGHVVGKIVVRVS